MQLAICCHLFSNFPTVKIHSYLLFLWSCAVPLLGMEFEKRFVIKKFVEMYIHGEIDRETLAHEMSLDSQCHFNWLYWACLALSQSQLTNSVIVCVCSFLINSSHLAIFYCLNKICDLKAIWCQQVAALTAIYSRLVENFSFFFVLC